ncbi:uncharacterized protein VTP21DRAFT_2103 [Calcarisporiella thermophila]|uniref:uncharacterized protein n=1 Tax=Calcarisporiella thermophila TaxID=911321 RepID=UPI0037439561
MTDALVPDIRPECPTPLQLVRYGRPLFGALAKDASYLPEVLTLAVKKLDGARIIGGTKEGALARLACLAAIKLSPRAELAKRMVADHMATMLGVSPDWSNVCITYPSEPVLAAGTLSYYGNEELWSRDIRWLAEALSEGFADSGECGEAATRIALLRAMQKACKSNYTSPVDISFCEPVTVKQFLSSLVLENRRPACDLRNANPELDGNRVGFIKNISQSLLAIVEADNKEHQYEESDVEDELYQGQVAFNHFLSPYRNSAKGPLLSDRDPDVDLLKACWQRRAAINLRHGYKAIDLVIPVRLKTGDFSCVAVKVSNQLDESPVDISNRIWEMELKVRDWFKGPPARHLNLYISLNNANIVVEGSLPLTPIQRIPGAPNYLFICNQRSFAFTDKFLNELEGVINSGALLIPPNAHKLTLFGGNEIEMTIGEPVDRINFPYSFIQI